MQDTKSRHTLTPCISSRPAHKMALLCPTPWRECGSACGCKWVNGSMMPKVVYYIEGAVRMPFTINIVLLIGWA